MHFTEKRRGASQPREGRGNIPDMPAPGTNRVRAGGIYPRHQPTAQGDTGNIPAPPTNRERGHREQRDLPCPLIGHTGGLLRSGTRSFALGCWCHSYTPRPLGNVYLRLRGAAPASDVGVKVVAVRVQQHPRVQRLSRHLLLGHPCAFLVGHPCAFVLGHPCAFVVGCCCAFVLHRKRRRGRARLAGRLVALPSCVRGGGAPVPPLGPPSLTHAVYLQQAPITLP